MFSFIFCIVKFMERMSHEIVLNGVDFDNALLQIDFL